MLRYLERVDNMARLLAVNHQLVLDSGPDVNRWRPLLIVAGEEPRFLERFGAEQADDPETVQEYLCWDAEDPVSLATSLGWARENARTIRETISLEMWECLNGEWLWLSRGPGRRTYNRDRMGFYARLSQLARLFRGVSIDTTARGEAYDFMLLGLLLERAGHTARMLDVKHHALQRRKSDQETAGDYALAMAILRSCNASESFMKSGWPLAGPEVAEYLVGEPGFPRAIRHCLQVASGVLGRIGGERQDVRSLAALDSFAAELRKTAVGKLDPEGLHKLLTWLIDRLAELCSAVQRDFFDPPWEAGPVAAAGGNGA
jgi:uncharacterized alpha-E superfamily protein